MSVENHFLLKGTPFGLMVVGCNVSTTLLPKRVCPSSLLDTFIEVLSRNDPAEIAQLCAELYLGAQQNGWENAPVGYFLKHHGWALAPSIGTGADAEIIIRSDDFLHFE